MFHGPLVRALLATFLVLGLGTPPAQAQTLEHKEAEAEVLRTDVEKLLRALEDANHLYEEAKEEVADLEVRRAELSKSIEEATDDLRLQVRTRFKLGTTPAFAVLFGGGTEIAERASLMAVLESRQVANVQQASNMRASLASLDVVLNDRLARLQVMTSDLDARQAELSRRLSTVQGQVDELRSRKARQTSLSRGAQNGVYACIFDRGNYHYINSWGDARSGGRSHQGTDVMAPRRANVYAFTTGRIERMKSGGLGGTVLYLRGDDGHRYYYAHLDAYASGIYAGRRVEAGELLAYNGSTGNAEYSAPHVHFEVHPGGGSAVNPYHWLTPICP